MKAKHETTLFLLDRSIRVKKQKRKIFYLVKSYTESGNIVYFDEDEKLDGFSKLIHQLENKKSADLYISICKLPVILELINEIQLSVRRAKLTLIYHSGHAWKHCYFYF